MLYGYIGKMLFVNLSTGKTEVRELTEDVAKNFIGGYGIGAKILYEEMPANCDPFGEESMIGIVTGPLNGTNALFGGRYTVVSKSPVTDGWNDANSGGFFAPKLKQAGFDAVFVNGISDKPVYIFINDGEVEIRDASHLWGKGYTTEEVEKMLEDECGGDIKSALIAPAGEYLSLMAAVMNDGHRAAGRGGSGAVMGSKKLKAVVARGTHKTPVYDQEKLIEINKSIAEWMKTGGKGAADGFGNFGTGGGYLASVLTNDASIKNWAGTSNPDYPEDVAYNVSSQGMDAKYKTKKYHCASCPLGCGAIFEVKDGPWPIAHTTRPEYETQGAFGSQMANFNAESVIKCSDLCNRYGFDTISLGSTVAWAMECYENGLITKEDLGGVELTWGNGEAIVAVTEMICKNEGFGRILSLGSRGAADQIGKGHEYLVVANGIEEPQHDSRLGFNLARTYQYDPTPGRHVKGGSNFKLIEGVESDFGAHGYEDMLGVVRTEILNCSGACLFMGMCSPTPLTNFEQVKAITGFEYSLADRLALGLRIFNMRQAFNVREGFRRKDYKLSERFIKSDPPHGGPIAGIVVDNEKMADSFFNAIGWTMDAVPSKASMEMMGGLENVIADIYPEG